MPDTFCGSDYKEQIAFGEIISFCALSVELSNKFGGIFLNKENLIQVQIIRKAEQAIANWSGGTTTELSIWPEGACYKERRFDWRISSAGVDLDESTFTSLPGVHRSLMLLYGAIHLVHEGIRERDMVPFAPADEFEGDWTTKSTGRCTDFNLMTSSRCRGTISAVCPSCRQIALFEEEHEMSWETFYCIAEEIHLVLKNGTSCKEMRLQKGDFLLISMSSIPQADCSLAIEGIFDKVPMIRTTIFCIE